MKEDLKRILYYIILSTGKKRFNVMVIKIKPQ